MTTPTTVGPHLLRGRHDVPTAALIHRNPFLGLLAEVYCLLAAGAFDHRAQEVHCPRPVAVGMGGVGVGVASVAVVTAVVHVALRVNTQRLRFYSLQCKM